MKTTFIIAVVDYYLVTHGSIIKPHNIYFIYVYKYVPVFKRLHMGRKMVEVKFCNKKIVL